AQRCNPLRRSCLVELATDFRHALRYADHRAHRRHSARSAQELDVAAAEPRQCGFNVVIVSVEREQSLDLGLALRMRDRLEQLLLACEIDIQGSLRDSR